MEHLEDFGPAHRTSFDQADHHLDVGQHPGLPRPGAALRLRWVGGLGRRSLTRIRIGRRGLTRSWWTTALLVEVALFPLALGRLVIGDTPDDRLTPAVSSLAAKRTPQVLPAAIAGIGEEKNAAMPASNPAGAQERFGPQNRSQNQVILQDPLSEPRCPIPVRSKLKLLRDQSCKKPRLSLWMLMYSKAPSSCPNDTQMSRQDEDSPHALPNPTTTATHTRSLEGEHQRHPLRTSGPVYLSRPRLNSHERHRVEERSRTCTGRLQVANHETHETHETSPARCYHGKHGFARKHLWAVSDPEPHPRHPRDPWSTRCFPCHSVPFRVALPFFVCFVCFVV
jgi:hypothetical protein